MPFDDGKKTVSGAIAHTDDAAAKVPFVSVKCGIAPTLSGVSSVVCTQAGKNLLDTANAETKSNNSVSVICDGNGKYTATGTATGGSANITFTLKTPCTIKSGMYLHLMNSGASGSVSITLQKQDNTTIYAPALSPANRIADLSSYAGQTIYSIRFYIANGASFEMTLTPMACFSNTATTYEPYQTPTVYNASLGRTIYGGTADVVNGVGSETYKLYTASDVTSLYWNAKKAEQVDTNHRASFRIALSSGYITVNNSLCNELSYSTNIASGSGAYEGYQLIATAGIYFCIDLSDIGMENATSSTPDEDFLAAIRNYGDNLKFVVELATPTDFTFTPITPTPETVGKVNNVYCDTGNTELTYYDNAHGFSEVTVNKNGVSQTAYLHKVIYGGQADVVRGTCEPKNLFDVGATPGNYEDPAKIESVENGVVSMTIRGSGSTYTYRKQDLTDKGMVTLSLKSSVSRSRLFVEFRSLDDTKWLDNNDITIAESGWSYNQYYHGWYSETASTSITKTITIPNCLYWRVGIGFASNAAEVGTVQTLSDIMVEKASSASEYTPYFEPFTFPPISMETDEGENTLFANEGGSAITYRKDTE